MRRMIAALAIALLMPACASAAYMNMTEMTEPKSGSRMVIFSVKPDTIDVEPGKESMPDEAQLAIWAKIEERFRQGEVIKAAGRGTLTQTGSLWQDGKTASMGLIWQGEQAGGKEGCTGAGLTVDLETGDEILLEQLFADYDGALAEMERIITDDVLDSMSDYMEYADLLPMPADQFSISERGLTIYWPEDRYRYFDGTSGSILFYWHELAAFIDEGSPAYALAHPDIAYSRSNIETLCFGGRVDPYLMIELGDLLGDTAQTYPLADPDYTTDALVYPLERERGFAVEIPKYAQTDEENTAISAIRASRISFAGLLTTGKTTDVQALALLGEPVMEKDFDEDAAFDAMLEPGNSLYYDVEGRVMQLHFDENGVLSCVILRAEMPETLF